MIRDAEATRQRLLDAALAEFARYGIAGARVERIAAAAQSNKAQIYHYFGSKAELFDAVFARVVARVGEAVPFDPADLPGYAARLARLHDEQPEIMRMVLWQRLERGADPDPGARLDHAAPKSAAIAQAQADGVVSGHYPPDVVHLLVLYLASVWSATNPEYSASPDREAQARYALVEDIVRRLLAP